MLRSLALVAKGYKYDVFVSFYGLFKVIFQQQLINDFTVINYLDRR